MKLELTSTKEHSKYYSRADIGGLEFIEATFITHRFARHYHDYYAVGVIETGVQTFTARGGKQITPTGGVFLLNPGEPHDGEAATTAGFSYRTFYPSTELLQNIVGEVTGNSPTLPFFAPLIVTDPMVTKSLLRLHYTLTTSTSSLEAETRLLQTFALLITRYADQRFKSLRTGQENQAVRRVKEYLQAHYRDNPSLNDLARQVSLSPYYLARVFQSETGLPPHAYLESLRVRQAQNLLIKGQPPAQVAYQVGFADQSHFQNRFKRLMGVTPRQYAQQRKILQDFTV